jgi:hypothetical protein
MPALQFKWIMIALIWIGMGLSLATGFYYTPNTRLRRSDDPKAFWTFWLGSLPLAMIATYLALQLPV